MVLLIEQLHEIKDYKVEALYLAVSLADRYLKKIISLKRKIPCLITLAVATILMAAKLEQPISPSFTRMINILNEQHSVLLKKQKVIDMEEDIIRTLDFNLRTVSPIHFLERFLRLYGIDQPDSKIAR